jgi:hypothetical protein
VVGKTKKINLAKEQLEDAVALLFSERYISALTLFGAAEEVLSRLLEEQGLEPPLEEFWSGINEWNRSTGRDEISKKHIYRVFNEPRNSVKHHTPGQDSSVALFKVAAAGLMAKRAATAASNLQLKYKNKKQLEAWLKNFYAN